ncbi:MAG: ATP-binding cassette domain-containing protein [Desulfobacterales bacterium]|nr:MAG: ATP-binding cassette domain-containing protein [Desulfobacterales bacterium]
MRIELQDIHKHYGPVKANSGVSLKISPGRIHGILGENGAGKSTLMKILAGFSQKTDGSILIDGKTVNYRDPAHAAQLGIGMLYQDPLDFPLLSVLDNFMMGQTEGISEHKMTIRKQFIMLADSLNFALNPDAPVKILTIGERQQLELLRLLALGIQVLILDEPTTGISSTQKTILFDSLKKLATEGKSVILVSHKLEDVETLCDEVTVLRQGKVTGDMDQPFDANRLLKMMFGAPPVPPGRIALTPGSEVLVMRNVVGTGGRSGLEDCSVVIRQGEIVGLAGLEGSGQGVFLRIAGGLQQATSGSIQLAGHTMGKQDHHTFRRRGATFMPASRLEEGLITGMSITEHFALQHRPNAFFLKWQEARKLAAKRIETFRIKGTPDSRVDALSGGNQQRLLLSFLPENPILLLLENPTRGLDVESVIWVWQQLQDYCRRMTSIVFSSSEIDEILMVADRVLVFFNGRIIKDLECARTDVHELGMAIAGKV